VDKGQKRMFKLQMVKSIEGDIYGPSLDILELCEIQTPFQSANFIGKNNYFMN
jgi:hypothetical protein